MYPTHFKDANAHNPDEKFQTGYWPLLIRIDFSSG